MCASASVTCPAPECFDAPPHARRLPGEIDYDISIVMNTDMLPDPGFAPGETVKNRLPAIVARTLPIVVDQTDQNGLALIKAAGNQHSNLAVRWTSAAANPCARYNDDKHNREFKPKKMNCLIEFGESGIWQTEPWQ